MIIFRVTLIGMGREKKLIKKPLVLLPWWAAMAEGTGSDELLDALPGSAAPSDVGIATNDTTNGTLPTLNTTRVRDEMQ